MIRVFIKHVTFPYDQAILKWQCIKQWVYLDISYGDRWGKFEEHKARIQGVQAMSHL